MRSAPDRRPDVHGIIPQRGRVPWIALIGLLALALGIVVAARQWSRTAAGRAPASGAIRPTDPGTPVPATDTSSAGDIDRALAQPMPPPRSGNSAADGAAMPAIDKHAWVDSVKGADVAALDARQRERFVRFANAEACTCGCGYTLASCRIYDPTCPVSGPRVASLLDSVRRGLPMSTAGLRDRPSRMVLPKGHPPLH